MAAKIRRKKDSKKRVIALLHYFSRSYLITTTSNIHCTWKDCEPTCRDNRRKRADKSPVCTTTPFGNSWECRRSSRWRDRTWPLSRRPACEKTWKRREAWLTHPPTRATEACQTSVYGTVPPQMVEEQRDIQAKCDPLSGTHEHQAEEPVDGVLRHHQLTRTHTETLVVSNYTAATPQKTQSTKIQSHCTHFSPAKWIWCSLTRYSSFRWLRSLSFI